MERQVVDTPSLVRLIAKVKKGDADERAALEEHKADHDNPHQVTAHQTGAYTQQETDDRISDHLHHDETLVGTGSANDPIGVNPEVVEDNVLRMQYRGGGRLKFWRGNPLPTT
jgi:hypothetical protein